MAIRITGVIGRPSTSCCRKKRTVATCTTTTLVSSANVTGGGTTTKILITFARSRYLISVSLNGSTVDPAVNAIGASNTTFTIDLNQLVLIGSATVNVVVRDPNSTLASCIQTFPFTVTSGGVTPQPPT